jgi:TatD DNase family protein
MVLDMIEQHLDLDLNSPVLHWFSGSAAEAKRAAALGCSFSINNQMLGKSKTNALLAAIPETSILTETDGPFTTISGRPNRPKDVELCVSNLAAALGKSPVETRRLVFENLLSLLAKKDRQRKLAYPAT